MRQEFEGKTVLVTGAAAGIGKATAAAFAKEGATVIASDIALKDVDEFLTEIGGEGRGEYIPCDVSDDEQVEALFHQIVSSYGRLDCAVNNAGIDIEKAGEWGRPDVFDRIWSVNGRGVFQCMRHEIAQMVSQGGGAIVNMSSIAGLTGVGPFAYSAAKHAVVGMTRSAALTFASDNIRINCVCPGAIDTAMISGALISRPGARESVEQMHPLGRLGRAEDVAEAVLWLCSSRASFVTGHAMPVDGGYTAK